MVAICSKKTWLRNFYIAKTQKVLISQGYTLAFTHEHERQKQQ